MSMYSYYEYYTFFGARFFTMVLKPERSGKFPAVVTRSPYVSGEKETAEELVARFQNETMLWAEHNYVFIFQHCRGRGKSSGSFVPYIREREDGLALREWIRKQSFYNGQIFLLGGSYTASLHYSTAPFEPDIKGAVFQVQDSERYRLWYRNGNMRRGHANWYFNLYQDPAHCKKPHTMESFSELPLKNLSERIFGERAEDFEQMLAAPDFGHPFWQTRFGGKEARDALSSANIPILLTTGYNDFYVGGMFQMWNEMTQETREQCALIVSPYDHGHSYDRENGIRFAGGSIAEQFGNDYPVRWFDAILRQEQPFIETGKITYYRTFEDRWETDFYSKETKETVLPLAGGEKILVYDPEDPPSFLSEGVWMHAPGERDDIISLYTHPAERDLFIKGKIRAKLTVSSDCEDTSFYIMIGIHTKQGDYALRHDITSLWYQKKHYVRNEKVVLDFLFDEYAFRMKKGEFLRIDIAPTDKNTYVCHQNQIGDYHLIEHSQVATNRVYLDESCLILPIEI